MRQQCKLTRKKLMMKMSSAILHLLLSTSMELLEAVITLMAWMWQQLFSIWKWGAIPFHQQPWWWSRDWKPNQAPIYPRDVCLKHWQAWASETLVWAESHYGYFYGAGSCQLFWDKPSEMFGSKKKTSFCIGIQSHGNKYIFGRRLSTNGQRSTTRPVVCVHSNLFSSPQHEIFLNRLILNKIHCIKVG